MGRYSEVVADSARESIVFTAIGGVIALPIFSFAHLTYLDAFAFSLLIESCGLMLLGGVTEFTSTGVVRQFLYMTNRHLNMDPAAMQKQGKHAVLYTLTGVILFLESLLIAVLLSF